MFWENDPWWKEEKKTFWDGIIPPSQFELEKAHQYRLDIIPEAQNRARCLDVGAGSGLFTERISKDKRYEVIGMDCCEKAIELAQARGIKMLKINIEEDKFPFPDKYFDLITCFEVIEHIKKPSNMLNEVYRTLKDNGYFIISTPNIAWWYLRLKLLLGTWSFHDPDHIRFFTPKSLKGCLNFFNFKVVKINSFFYFPQIVFLRLPCFHSISYNFVFQCVKTDVHPK